MESHRPRRRQTNNDAVDITWISCRGVRSAVPFRAPSLYASVRVLSSPSSSSAEAAAGGFHAYPRVTTAVDGDGGENPEWDDAPLRLYLPERVQGSEDGGAPLVTFEIREELPLLGDVLAASANVPVADLAAAGSSGRSSYQLAAADGKNPNGVVSFSYALHGDPVTSPVEAAAASWPNQGIHWPSPEQVGGYPPLAVAAEASVLMYPPPVREAAAASWPNQAGIHWLSTEQVGAYPPLTVAAEASVVMYPPPAREAACCFTVAEQVAVYPPLPGAACGVYPPIGAPRSYFPPPPSASPWSDPYLRH